MSYKDYISFIFPNNHILVNIKLSDIQKINKIIHNTFKNISELICLDFHGVSDLYEQTEKIPNNLPKCIISYIGGSPKTIKSTIEAIKPRVDNNEILLGIIVYTKDEKPSCGTKGWIINVILQNNLFIKNLYFIDDSKRNVKCVKNLNNLNIKVYLIDKYSTRSPKNQLNKILLKL